MFKSQRMFYSKLLSPFSASNKINTLLIKQFVAMIQNKYWYVTVTTLECVTLSISIKALPLHIQLITASWASSSNTRCLRDTSRWDACLLQMTSRTTLTGTPSSKQSHQSNGGMKRETKYDKETYRLHVMMTCEVWDWPTCSFHQCEKIEDNPTENKQKQ